MSDANDQNTPNDDFSQSIDEESADATLDGAADVQSPEINEEITPQAAPLATKPKSTAAAAVATGASLPKKTHDLNTLLGRLEKKLSEINEVLWEKEGMQMQFVFRTGIRGEYYRRWKAEANFFVGLAARLQKRIDRERKRLNQAS
jgi:hypothetical protein